MLKQRHGWTQTFTLLAALASMLALTAATAQAQSSRVVPRAAAPRVHRALASNVVVPQWRAVAPGAATTPTPEADAIVITAVNARVGIVEQVATTTIDVAIQNNSNRRQEAEVLLPVPDKAVVRGFDFEGKGAEPSAELLPRDEARRIYDDIVRQTRDPALLEFIGYNLVRSSVFPVEANGKQKVRLVYEHILPADGPRVDYILPRTESVQYNVPWEVTVSIKSKQPVSTVYSPSHKIQTARENDKHVVAKIAPDAVREPGVFRLSYLVEQEGVTASMFAYPDPKNGGGYFLLLAGLPAKPENFDKEHGIKREVTLVIDRSGSMNGEKLDQVKEAALQVIAGLNDGEAFNLIVYNEAVELFAKQPVIKNDETTEAARAYIKAIKARGGTNIHDAVLEALRPKPVKGFLPIVLFLTDGLPTVGQTSEKAIRDTALKGNRHERRIFTFGVGADVNTPLLEKIAFETRATPTFVLPSEDVEVKVSYVFKRLAGPVLAGTDVDTIDENGKAAPGRVMDVLPTTLPDLFDGDQLVLIGRYVGDKPVHFQIKGNYLGTDKAFKFTFNPDKATTRNAYVPRLWASRKIADLIDEIRNMGADTGGYGQQPGVATPSDPRLKELIDEVVRLSTEFGILTEYTAFLAREGTDLNNKCLVLEQARLNFVNRAWMCRSGIASINQDVNNTILKQQTYLNGRNEFLDANLDRVGISTVQQVNDKAFYRRGGAWIDSELVDKENKDAKVIEFGSPQFNELVDKLTTAGRNGCVSLQGDVLLNVDGQAVLIKATKVADAAKQAPPKDGANASQQLKN